MELPFVSIGYSRDLIKSISIIQTKQSKNR